MVSDLQRLLMRLQQPLTDLCPQELCVATRSKQKQERVEAQGLAVGAALR